MRNIILVILFLCGGIVHAQEVKHISLTATIGTGFNMSKPSYTPFIGQVIGNYNFNERYSVGIGTGVSRYEKVLIPLFADAKVHVCQPRAFTPFIRCSAGYGLAVSDDAKGGIYINPAIGLSYAVYKQVKLLVQIGYEMQKLVRLKKYEDAVSSIEFVEKLSHNSISLKIGIEF